MTVLYGGANITGNLTNWWRLDDGSGTTATDSVGSYDGTLTNMDGATDWVSPGKKGAYHLVFDGTGEYVSFSTALLNSLSSGSWSAWIYPTALTTSFRYVVAANSWNGSGSGELAFRIDTDGGGWWAVNNAVGSGDFNNGSADNGTIAINTWYLITLTWNGTNWKFYRDTTLRTTVTNSNVTSSATNTPWLGDGWDGNGFIGRIDDVRVYDAELSSDEITVLHTRADTPYNTCLHCIDRGRRLYSSVAA